MKEEAIQISSAEVSKDVPFFTIGFAKLIVRDHVEDAISAGSGSLVTVGSLHGVLTAAHVADALPKKGPIGIVLSFGDPARFRRQTIEMEHVDVLTIHGKDFGPDGPDIAFMRLPPAIVSQLSATSSFYNLEKRRDDVLANKVPTSSSYADAIVGMIHELTKDIPSDKPRVRSKEFGAIFSGGKITATKDANSFDLFDFEVVSTPDFAQPLSFEGASGGAVWRFYLAMKDGKPSVVEKRLIGIPFYQSPSVDGKNTITCHGPRGIYGSLIDKIHTRWPESTVATLSEKAPVGQDFIRDIVADDLEAGRHKTVVTRFPPEPNGYLHIGHAKSICLNFGVAQEFGGRCHLRFDDTNPTREEQEYIDAIEADVRWLGFDWGTHLYHASDYFERLYEWAEVLIRAGKAYVDDQTQDDMRAARGTLTEPGRNSPFRERPVEENLDLFRRMRAGEFPNGARVLRARIDMTSGNINLRDPVLYRILHATHPRTGTEWKIYPSYDYAHGQSDAIEGITHSICTLEFEDHRPLYDWFIENLPVPSRPHQYEFARLNLAYTVLSKRVLNALVKGGHVSGWDDPRMPTLAGLRRRGVPPEALRDFAKRIGVAKANSLVDLGLLDFSIREVLNKRAQRRMAVLRPLKVVIENYEGAGEELDAVNHPDDPGAGTRRVRFGREIFIERDDFMENPPKKFFRLSPGMEVRLRYAYFITCKDVLKNAAGEVTELHCTYDPATRGGNAPDGRKVKATIHWVSATDSVVAEVRLYNPLFTKPEPDVANFANDLNPNSLEVLSDVRVEPALIGGNSPEPVQFERQGYFAHDKDSAPGKPVFNRTVGLRDSYAKAT